MRIGLVAGKSSEILTTELLSRGHSVFLLCGRSSDPGFNIATKSLEVYFTIENSKESIAKAVNFFEENKINAFILGTGTWFTFEIADMLSKKGVRVSHNIEVSKIFKDKVLTKDLFVQNGILTPEYSSYSTLNQSIIDEIEYPKVIKSRIDLFPVFLCKKKTQLKNLLETVDKSKLDEGILVEECIEGNDITIPVSATKGKVEALGVIYWSKQHNYKLEGFNDLLPVKLPDEKEQELLLVCKKFIEQIGYFGLCRFDIRITEKESFFLEINSVISIRNEGSSYQSMLLKNIILEKIAIDTYLENIRKS